MATVSRARVPRVCPDALDRDPVAGRGSTVRRMGLIYRRRKRLGRSSWLNVSKRGASVSEKVGPVTVNSRGRVRVRLGKGLSWRIK